ncbi:MAG: DegV family protein [Gemmatimonadota bacterium]
MPTERARARIAYLDGHRLRRTLLAAIEHVSADRRELNRINVFPVPDGDTGTNLTLTLRSMSEALEPLESGSVSEVAGVAAEACVLGARGNSGMLFSRFVLGFARSLGQKVRAGTREVAEALSAGSGSLREVLESPQEGTIITVARDVADEGRRRAPSRRDFHEWLRDLLGVAESSLQRTRLILPALREAGVVDAGAKGFVSFLEGILRYVEGRERVPADGVGTDDDAAGSEGLEADWLRRAREAGIGGSEGRWCTQIALRGEALPEDREIRRALAGHGTSTIVLRAGTVAKIHIHSDDPDAVRSLLAGLGEIISERFEDTRQVKVQRRVAVVTDSSADLSREWVESHGVDVVPLLVLVGDETYRDGVDLTSGHLGEILSDPEAPLPTTSQPALADFTAVYQEALDRGAEEMLGVFVGSSLSGTLGTATAAMRELDCPWEIVDSRTSSLGLGLLVARAVELLDEGLSVPEVAAELARVRTRSNLLFTVDRLDHLLRSGRVGRLKAWLGGLLDLKPILGLDSEGHVVSMATVRGSDGLVPRILSLLDEVLEGVQRYRFGIAHFGAADAAEQVRRSLAERYDPVEIHVGPVTAALAVHTGPCAWAVAYQIED